jgi:hypothetical protein
MQPLTAAELRPGVHDHRLDEFGIAGVKAPMGVGVSLENSSDLGS